MRIKLNELATIDIAIPEETTLEMFFESVVAPLETFRKQQVKVNSLVSEIRDERVIQPRQTSILNSVRTGWDFAITSEVWNLTNDGMMPIEIARRIGRTAEQVSSKLYSLRQGGNTKIEKKVLKTSNKKQVKQFLKKKHTTTDWKYKPKVLVSMWDKSNKTEREHIANNLNVTFKQLGKKVSKTRTQLGMPKLR